MYSATSLIKSAIGQKTGRVKGFSLNTKLSDSAFFFFGKNKVVVLARYGGVPLYYEKATELALSMNKNPPFISVHRILFKVFSSRSPQLFANYCAFQ